MGLLDEVYHACIVLVGIYADIAALTVVGLGFNDYLKVYGKKDSLKKDKSVGNKGLEFLHS